jgi:thymidine kinase
LCMSKAGELSLIVGGMFSGKSTELQRQGRRKELAGKRVLFVKPKIDNRYTEGAISTHDGQDVKAVVIDHVNEIIVLSQHLELDVVCIDEVQFFDIEILQVIEHLLRRGIDVVASGLDLDRFGEPFGAVPVLAMKAEKLTKLNAVCSSCGDDAWVSAGQFKSDSQIEVGEKDKYTPLCRSCYYEKGGIL